MIDIAKLHTHMDVKGKMLTLDLFNKARGGKSKEKVVNLYAKNKKVG